MHCTRRVNFAASDVVGCAVRLLVHNNCNSVHVFAVMLISGHLNRQSRAKREKVTRKHCHARKIKTIWSSPKTTTKNISPVNNFRCGPLRECVWFSNQKTAQKNERKMQRVAHAVRNESAFVDRCWGLLLHRDGARGCSERIPYEFTIIYQTHAAPVTHLWHIKRSLN